MDVLFFIAADVAVVATVLAVTSRVVLHALLYLALSLIAVAVVFFTLGAAFVAVLEVVIYAGAIVVLFLFAVMLLSSAGGAWEWRGRRRRDLILPALLALILLGELIAVVSIGPGATLAGRAVAPRAVGVALFGPYALGVELASMLLLVALIGARHLAARRAEEAFPEEPAGDDEDDEQSSPSAEGADPA